MEWNLDDVAALVWKSTNIAHQKKKKKNRGYDTKRNVTEPMQQYWITVKMEKNTELGRMAQKAGNVKGQQWGWLGRWNILAAIFFDKMEGVHKRLEDDKGNYLYCIHTCKNLNLINRAGK